MRALQYFGPGQLDWVDVPLPQLQAADDVILKPLAVASCDLDWDIVAGRTPFPAPILLGHEFVAEVMECGEDVSGFTPGQTVAVAFQPSCGQCPLCRLGETSACHSVAPTSMFGVGAVSGDWPGAFAERIRVPYARQMLAPLPAGLPLAAYASAADNLMDGYRAVYPWVSEAAGATVLIFGDYNSIPLYAVLCAKALGAARVTYCTTDQRAADNAARLGAEVELVSSWPQRLASHDVTVCASPAELALSAALRSTRAGGHCTSTTIFSRDVTVPVREMYMRGIHFHTGRVNSAGVLQEAVRLIDQGVLQPLLIDTAVVPIAEVIPGLLNRTAAKLVAVAD